MTGLTGVLSSTVVLCAASKCSYRFGSVLYLGVGILDAIIVAAW